MNTDYAVFVFPDFVTQKKHVFYNLLINNILYLCVT